MTVLSHHAASMSTSAESVKRLNLRLRIPRTFRRYTESVIASPQTPKSPEVQLKTDWFLGKNCMKTIIAILAIAVLCIGCADTDRTSASTPPNQPNQPASASGQVLLTGAGATFPYPIYSKWFDEYHRMFPQIQINYQSIGSGGGIRQVMEGTVDFGASDVPMTDEQLKQAKTKILHFPTVLGAVVPAYNIPGLTQEVNFTPETLAGIFLGKITNWNDPELKKAN